MLQCGAAVIHTVRLNLETGLRDRESCRVASTILDKNSPHVRASKGHGRNKAVGLAMLTGTMLLAACAKPTPPPEPIVVVTDPGPPVRPIPPLGAVANMYIPPADEVSGQRLTPNSNISQPATIWHFRSAFNVAALNCVPPNYASVNEYYSSFLTRMKIPLAKVNLAMDAEYRSRYPGAGTTGAARIRDTAATDIYNYFSLPPVTDQFCALMLEKGPAATMLTEDQLYPFAKQTLDEIDAIYIKFWEDYEDYQRRLAEWEALYGTRGMVIFGGGPASDTPPPPTPPGG